MILTQVREVKEKPFNPHVIFIASCMVVLKVVVLKVAVNGLFSKWQ